MKRMELNMEQSMELNMKTSARLKFRRFNAAALTITLFLFSGSLFAKSDQGPPEETQGVKSLEETKQPHKDADSQQNQEKAAKAQNEKEKPANEAASQRDRKEYNKKEQEKNNLKNKSYKRYSGAGK